MKQSKQTEMKDSMNKNKKYEMDMCSGPILSKMLMFALPLMLSSVLQLLFNAADVVVVGKFAGDNSLAAVGCTGSLVNLLVNLFVGLSVGANVMSARHFGAKQYDELSRTVHTAITVAAISGIILTFIGVVFADNILRLMSTPEPVLPLAALYLRIYFGGMVANMLYNFGSAILRAVGDTKRPMYFLTFAGVVNVVLNLIFVIVLKMDVAGVAIATVISQCISAFLVLRCLIMETGAIHLDVKKLGIDAAEFKNIVRIGLPAGLQGCVFSLSNVVIQSSINSFGETVVSGSAASANLEGFVYVAMNSFHHATLNFMSQNFGAGKYSRMKKVMICGLGCVIEAGITRLTINNTLYCLCGMMDVMVGVLRGIGYSVMPMIVSLVGACGTRLLWIATVFQIASFHRIETVYIAYPISWFLTFAAHVVCYFIVRRKAIPAVDKTVAE